MFRTLSNIGRGAATTASEGMGPLASESVSKAITDEDLRPAGGGYLRKLTRHDRRHGGGRIHEAKETDGESIGIHDRFRKGALWH